MNASPVTGTPRLDRLELTKVEELLQASSRLGPTYLRQSYGRNCRSLREAGTEAARRHRGGRGTWNLRAVLQRTMAEYQPISGGPRPIYAGKAVPKGSRRGSGELDVDHPALRTRLREHARSVEQVDNLTINEFSYRVLGIVPVWIVFAEQALIKLYKPVWNSCLDGFGKHHQGGRRK